MKKILVIFLLVISHCYVLMVGKYQIFPYKQLSNVKQQIISFFQSDIFYNFEAVTPAYTSAYKLKTTIELETEKRNELISPVIMQIKAIVEAEKKLPKSYQIKLDPIVGYIQKRSIKTGESLEVYVHAQEPYSVQISRLGAKKATYRTVGNFKTTLQDSLYSPKTGFDWKPSFKIDTTSYESGIYLVEMRGNLSGAFWQIPFIVRPESSPKIAFITSTYTWYAFNPFAGKNFYADNETSGTDLAFNNALDSMLNSLGLFQSSIHLPLNRPLKPESFILDTVPNAPHHSHLLRASWMLSAFAEVHSINFGFYADEDFNEHGDMMNAEILVFDAHTEYWSNAMINAYQQFVKKGGKVIFAGGNPAFKLVSLENNQLSLINDIDSSLRKSITGAINTGISNPLYAPFQILRPEHWVFSGASVKQGTTFGVLSSNHNPDSSYQGASGWEADQGDDSSGFTILAIGKNSKWPSHMLFKQTETGGWIFTAGSIPFAGSLFSDPISEKIMLNLLGVKNSN